MVHRREGGREWRQERGGRVNWVRPWRRWTGTKVVESGQNVPLSQGESEKCIKITDK